MDKKFFFQIVGLLILIFGATILTFNQSLIPNLGNTTKPLPSPVGNLQNVVQIIDPASQQIKAQVLVEIADTKETRGLGLGGRSSLPAESGMLFIMEKRSKPTFWMKGMLIPLDFIWIDGNQIADVLEHIQPPVAGQSDQTLQLYSPSKDVDRVLEVNSGYIASHVIKVGDLIKVAQIAPTK